MLPDFLTSSDGSGNLSGRASSFLMGLLPVIILILPTFGVHLTNEEGSGAVDLIVKLIAGVETIIAVVLQVKAWIKRNFNKENQLGKFAR